MNFGIKKINLIIFYLVFCGLLISLPVFAADSLNYLKNAVVGTGLDKSPKLAVFIGNIIEFVLGFLGLLFLVIIIYAGFIWTTAQGDSKKVDKAKDMLKNGIIGLAIVFAAYAIEFFVVSALASSTYNH